MSGYGSNPIFFNKKIKIGRPEHLLPPFPHPSTADSIFALPPTHPSSTLLNVDFICVSPFMQENTSQWKPYSHILCSSKLLYF